jgi:hypothetical protein
LVRSRLVADAFGAPVRRDQGPDRPAGHGKADTSLELFHAMHSLRRLLTQASGIECGKAIVGG